MLKMNYKFCENTKETLKWSLQNVTLLLTLRNDASIAQWHSLYTGRIQILVPINYIAMESWL